MVVYPFLKICASKKTRERISRSPVGQIPPYRDLPPNMLAAHLDPAIRKVHHHRYTHCQ